MTHVMCETSNLQIMNETFYVPAIYATVHDFSLPQTLLHLDLLCRDLTEYLMMIRIEREYSDINTVEYGIVKEAEERMDYTMNEYDTESNFLMKIFIERGHSDAAVE